MAKDQHPESLVDAEDVQNSVKTIVEPADILPSVEPVGLNSLVRDVRLVPFTISSSAFEETTGTETYPREATKKESETLRHVADKVPVSAWIVAITGAAAQFSYYGVSVPWQNYMQNPPGVSSTPGALGLGQAAATIISNAFLFFQYLIPTAVAVASDAWLGRYRTMLICLGSLTLGCTVLLITSLPVVSVETAGLPGLVIAIIFIGLGRGGLKAILYPFIGDQLPDLAPRVVRTKRGELVTVDRALTVQYIFNVYYWMTNIAGLSLIATTFLEKYVAFWAAYLPPALFLWLAVIPFITWNHLLVKFQPQGNVLPQASRVLYIACRSNFRLSAAHPAEQQDRHERTVPWTAEFVEEIRRGLRGCRVTIWFLMFYLCYHQVLNNIISQAGQMQLGVISNDTIQALNPIACIILGPVIQNLLFPFLHRRRIAFGPIARIAVAFVFTGAAVAYASGVQRLIYSRGPCYQYPLECPAAQLVDDRRQPNDISVWVQTPFHFLLGVGEILGLVSLSEYSYAEAPTNMKALVQAFQQVTAALAAVLGVALGPVSRNPFLVIMYACIAGAMAITTALFSAACRRYGRASKPGGTEGVEGEDELEPKGNAEKGNAEAEELSGRQERGATTVISKV